MSELEQVNMWKARIKRAEQEQGNLHNEWKQALALLNCKYFEQHGAQIDERVDVNFVNWYVSNLVPLIYFRDPFIFVKPKTEDWSAFAETLEKVVNVIWKDQKLKQQFKRVILSSLLMPPGWIEVGYTAKIDEDVAQTEKNEEKGLIKMVKDAIKGVLPKNDDKLPQQQGILNQNIKEESVFVDWVPSWNVLMAPGYHLVSKMPWLVKYEDVAIVDFIANPMYKNKKNIRGIYKDDSPSGGKLIRQVGYEEQVNVGDVKDDITTIRLYHIWDIRSQKRMTITLMSEKYHFEGDWPYDFEGFPLEPLIFEETLPNNELSEGVPSAYPYNVVRPILPQVVEQSSARTQMAAYRRRAGAIIIAQSDMVTEEDMNQIQQSEAVQLIRVTNLAGFVMQQTPQLPPQVFQVDGVIKEDLQAATNMGQLMFQPQEGQRTATQAQIAQSGLQLKISAKQDCVEDLTVAVSRKICQLAWQFLDKEQVQELIGEIVSDVMWPDLPENRKDRRRMINNMNIFIDAGAAAPPKDETVDRKQLLDAISIANSIAPEVIKKAETVSAIFKKFKFEKDIEKLVITNDEGEIQCAMEENGLLDAGIPCIVSPNNNHLIHLEEHAKGAPTPARDQHMLEHAKFGGLLPGTGVPGSQGQPGGAQEGDVRPPMSSTNPEIVRQGNPSADRMAAAAQDRGPGTGQKARPSGGVS